MRPVDRLLLAFLALLGALAAAVVPSPWALLGALLGMAAALVASARLGQRFPRLEVVHAFLPVPLLALLVNLVGPVIEHTNAARWDAVLAQADLRWFGALLTGWRHALGRPAWLTDAASLAYASYYLLPVGGAAALWARGDDDPFDRYVFALSAVLLASYAAYFLLPAAGPRVPEALAAAQLGGGQVSALLRLFLRTAERNALDAFPSGHTAVSLVFLAESWPHFPRLRAPLALAVAAIVFSTVYLSLHYVTDVVGGALLAGLVLAALPRLRQAIGRPDEHGVRWTAA